MADNKEDNNSGDAQRESISSNLTNGLFGNAFLNNAIKYAEKAKHDLDRGANEQAGENMKRGLDALKGVFFTPTPSSYLSDSENGERQKLIQRLFKVDQQSGLIVETGFSEQNDHLRTRLSWLDKKARGVDPNS